MCIRDSFRVCGAFLFALFASADFFRIDFAKSIHETREIGLLFVRALGNKLLGGKRER